MWGRKGHVCFGLLAVVCIGSPCAAQPVPVVDAAQAEVKTVVVVGKKRGLTIDQAPPRLSLKAAEIQALGADSVSELLDLLKSQTRSASGKPPIVLLNGHRVSGFSVLKDLPPEAVIRFDNFSEATALSYGYPAGQMVVNIVLAPDFLGRNSEASQAGAFRDHGGTTALKYSQLKIGESGRFNFALNYENTHRLMESERDVVTTTPGTLFDITGNVTATTGGAEIDPGLSALAGVPVIVAGVPSGLTALNDFGPYANLPRQTNLSPWRSLLPASEKYGANLSVSRTLFDSVEATLDGAITSTRKRGLQGLASGRLLLPASNPFSPFAGDVLINRYFAEAGALTQASDEWTGHTGLSLDGALKAWQWNLIGSADHTVSRSRVETGIDLSAIQFALDSDDTGLNPFLPLSFATKKIASSQNQTSDQYMIQIMATGTLAQLPAGPLNLSANIGGNGGRVIVRTDDGSIAQKNTVTQIVRNSQFTLFVPLSRKDKPLLPHLGSLTMTGSVNIGQATGYSAAQGFSYGAQWIPLERVVLMINQSRMEMAPAASALASNAIETPNVIVFDYVTGENAIVTQVYGGNADLPTARTDTTSLDLFLTPSPKLDLSFSTGLYRMLMTDVAGAVPPATPEAELAFPDRYTRDASGRLIRIDARTVSYARHETDELHTSLNYNCVAATSGWMKALRLPEGRLSLSLTHTLRLRDTVLIREGLPEIDRLTGGITGDVNQLKSQLEWNIGLTSPTGGLWFSGRWQDGARALGGTPESNLTFSKKTVANLRFFVNLGKLKQTGSGSWTQGLRATFSIDNLLDEYQAARDENGLTPALYQRGLVDPMGRTITLSLRKTF